MKLKLAHVVGLFTVCLVPHASGQVLLAQAHLTGGGGSAAITNSIGLSFNILGPSAWLFEGLFVQNGDVGRTYTIGPGDDPGFAGFVAALTDGVASEISYECILGRGGFGSGPFSEMEFFTSLPPGNNGIDLGGFEIDYFSSRFDAINITSPGSNPNGDGVWTDCSYSATFSVYGQPLLALSIVTPPLTQTAEMGSLAAFRVRAAWNNLPMVL
jgi:hypothetical protein